MLDPTLIDFAVDHLHVPLVVVLGHENCAAVALAADVRDGVVESGSLVATVAGLRATIGDRGLSSPALR